MSLWKAAVVYVLSIFMSGYLAVPKMHSCIAKPIFTNMVLKSAAPIGPPAPGAPPQKEDGKVWLLIVGLIALIVIGIIIYGIISMTKRIPAPDPPPPPPGQDGAQYVPGPYITDLKDGFVSMTNRHPCLDMATDQQPIYCHNITALRWEDQLHFYYDSNAPVAIFTNAFCVTLQSTENLKDWKNRICYVFYESTAGGILQTAFSNDVPVMNVYYKNLSYMDGQHFGRALKLEAKPQEYFRLSSMTNYPTSN